MQFYYGQQMPLRILDEAEFWKNQEEEHTVVIRESEYFVGIAQALLSENQTQLSST